MSDNDGLRKLKLLGAQVRRGLGPAFERIGKEVSAGAQELGRAAGPAAQRLGKEVSAGVVQIGRAAGPAFQELGASIRRAASRAREEFMGTRGDHDGQGTK